MTSRRQFIKVGITVSALPLAGFVNSLHAENRVLKLDHFVFDDRFKESIEVSEAIYQSGVFKHGVSEDLTKLWYKFLQVDLSQGPKIIAGITSKEALFFLERLGWTHNLRVVYRGNHDVPVKRVISHEINGAESIVYNISNSAEKSWTQYLAFALQHCDLAVLKQAKDTRLMSSNSNIERDIDLVSWLMVPTQLGSIS